MVVRGVPVVFGGFLVMFGCGLRHLLVSGLMHQKPRIED
jgi:hypothetical protein